MRRLSSRIRRLFIKAQIGLASAIVLGIIISSFDFSSQSLRDALLAWLVLAVLLCAGQLLLMAGSVQRFAYYRVWAGTLLRQAVRLAGGVEGVTRDLVHPVRPGWGWLLGWYDLPYENWIRESADWEPSGAARVGFALSPHPPGTPVLVQRDHLVGGYHWPGQSFATTILFKPVRVTRSSDGNAQLSIDLTDEAYGIYKNRGKQFLNYLLRQLQQEVPRAEMLDRSARLHRFLMETTKEPGEVVAGGPHQPLRWSSAGALPLVHWRRPGDTAADDWFALFFRGISPVGWNLASGSSESAQEWRNLFEVGVRELCEELVVLEGPPLHQGRPVPEVYRRRFRPGQALSAYPDLVRRLTGHDFVREHDRLREVQDQISISDDPTSRALRLDEIETNSTVKFIDSGHSYTTENVIFSVNPLEAGVESVFVFRFDLADDDYLLFGEVLEDLGALAREPVMLLRRSFVQRELAQHGSLGRLLPDQERKQLRGVPPGDYHIFDADIVLRERRLTALLEDLDIPHSEVRDAAHAAALRDDAIARRLGNEQDTNRGRMLLEARFHANWFAEYGADFASIDPGDPLEAHASPESPLLQLCAVTWKTLELACQHKVGA
ncbi:MAG TPA: hypothetical protein VGS19_27130 [Streptosporangiaceae bacterium]|nr:hypothetical protein [Streptosporangiaceae bacterium]